MCVDPVHEGSAAPDRGCQRNRLHDMFEDRALFPRGFGMGFTTVRTLNRMLNGSSGQRFFTICESSGRWKKTVPLKKLPGEPGVAPASFSEPI